MTRQKRERGLRYSVYSPDPFWHCQVNAAACRFTARLLRTQADLFPHVIVVMKEKALQWGSERHKFLECRLP